MDSQEIEQLRALAFASIPSISRKAVPPSVKPKRVPSAENEEGEIISDEDVDSAEVSHRHLHDDEALCKEAFETTNQQKEEYPFSTKSCEGGSREALPPVNYSAFPSNTPAQIHKSGTKQIVNPLVLGTTKGNDGDANKKAATVFRKDTKFIQQHRATMNTPRPSRMVPGSLPSRIPSAPLTAAGVRKEADVFLANLKIPRTASPSQLEGDRNNSLVIKFSDEDSDSDRDQQQGQVETKNSENIKSRANGIPLQGIPGGNLKSEIDRVKKQIAAFERTKGKVGSLPGSMLSKSTTKSRQLSTSVSSPVIPVELESLRQQIAAKESELQLRKRVSTDVIVSSQAADSRFGSPVDNEDKNRLELGQATVNLSTGAKSQVNIASNGLMLKKLRYADISIPYPVPNAKLGSSVYSEAKNITDVGQIAVAANAKPQVNATLYNLDDSSSKFDRGHTVEAHEQTTMYSKPAPTTDTTALISKTIKPSPSENVEVLASAPPLVTGDASVVTRDQVLGSVATNPGNIMAITTPKRKRDESKRSQRASPAFEGEASAKKKQKQYKSLLQMPSNARESPPQKTYVEPKSSCDTLAASSMAMESDLFKPPDAQESLNLSPKSSKNMENPMLAVPTIVPPEKKFDPQERIPLITRNTGDAMNVETSCYLQDAAGAENSRSCLIPFHMSNIQELLSAQMKTAPRKATENICTSQHFDDSCGEQTRKTLHISTSGSNEAQEDRLPFPDGKERMQMVFLGPTSTSSNGPEWALDDHTKNSNVHVFPEVSDKGLKCNHDTLQQWQEEEDMIDKELEAAQQNRRRCEVRERLARRQYREAQEALRSANINCEMLYQKREILADRIKAAELHLYSSKSCLHAQHDARTFLTFSSPIYSHTDRNSKRSETPLWSREHGTAQPDHKMDLDSRSASGEATGLIQDLEIYQKADCVVSGASDEHPSTDDPNDKIKDASGQITSQTKTAAVKDVEIQGKPGNNASEISCLLPMSKQLQPEIPTGFMINESDPESGYLNRENTDGYKSLTDDSLIASNLAENYACEMDKHYHHGFCSASFATDLDNRETSAAFQDFVDGDHVNSKDIVKLAKLITGSQSDSSIIQTIPPSIMHTVAECTIQETSNERNLIKFSEPVGSPNDFLPTKRGVNATRQDSCLPADKEAPQEPPADSLAVHSPLVRTDEQVVDAGFKETSLQKPHVSAIQGILNQKSSAEYALCIIQSPSVAFDTQTCKDLEDLVIRRNIIEELQDKQSEKVPGTKTAVRLAVESFMPSSSLEVLFTHASISFALERTMAAWEQQSSLSNIDEMIRIEPLKYESPLSACSSHNVHVDSLSSFLKTKYIVDPHKTLCKYEHRGKCNNDECIWQHKRDYALNSTPIPDTLNKSVDSQPKDVPGTTEKTSVAGSSTSALKESNLQSEPSLSPNELSWKWNTHFTKAPIYRIGSQTMKVHDLQSHISYLVCKKQIRFEQQFPALHRTMPIDMPCLYDPSLKLHKLGDSSLKSRQLLFGDTPRVEVEDRLSSNLEDVESLMEAALELIDFDFKVEKPEVQKTVLYMLSRGLEVKPFFVALWVVYLHLFSRWEEGVSKDDLFYHAVHHNKGSYELWMMFINSRGHLPKRLEAYEEAIVALGSQDDLQDQTVEKKSSILLDLSLQQLYCMCVSGLSEYAMKWIDKLMLSVSKDGEGHQSSTASIVLSNLVYSDLCILWICCAYVILESQIPKEIIENLGCKQPLCFQNIWCNVKVRKPCTSKAMKLMEIAASDGKGCLALDSLELHLDTESRLSKEVFAANYVQCAAACEGLELSLTLAEKFFNLYLSSVELTILRARLEAHFHGNMAGLSIFEKALSRWPMHQSGKLLLWNQYIGFSLNAKGTDSAKVLLARCAAEICGSESFRSVYKDFCGTACDVPVGMWNTLRSDLQSLNEAQMHGYIQKAFQLLPSIVKMQLEKEFRVPGQVFSYQDAVFGYLNLACSEALDGDFDSAKIALHNSLNIATDADVILQCLKEFAALVCGSLGSFTATKPSSNYEKMLNLLDRCLMEAQLLASTHPLSKGFYDSIKKRRVRHFVDRLLGDCPNNCTFFNTILETMYGPTLLPTEMLPMKEFIDFTEKVLEVLPNNVTLALAACRAVQAKVDNCNPLTKSATLFWSASFLVNSLYQSFPEAPESCWVEAGTFLELLELDDLSEAFYRLALVVYPFSTSLWSKLLMIGRKTGNIDSITELAATKGVTVDLQCDRIL